MTGRDPVDPKLEELSREYDGYVEIAIELAENRLSPRAARAVRERMKRDDMFRRVVQPVLRSYHAPLASRAELQTAWTDLRRRIAEVATHRLPPTNLSYDDVSDDDLTDYQERVRARSRATWRRVAMAAGFFIALVSIPITILKLRERTAYVGVETPPNATMVVTLPDRSVATLSPGARLRYFKDFLGATSRLTYVLRGEVTFDVARFGGKTFEVHTQQIRLIAVGTRFIVSTNGTLTQARVIEGRVLWQRLNENDEPVGRLSMLEAGEHLEIRP